MVGKVKDWSSQQHGNKIRVTTMITERNADRSKYVPHQGNKERLPRLKKDGKDGNINLRPRHE